MSVDEEKLKTAIRNLARDGCLSLSTHCRERLNGRNVDVLDVLQVLTWGDLVKHEKGKRRHEHRCKMKGVGIDGESLTVVVIYREDDSHLLCVTVHG